LKRPEWHTSPFFLPLHVLFVKSFRVKQPKAKEFEAKKGKSKGRVSRKRSNLEEEEGGIELEKS
jgi:hypothetical protein